MIKNYISVLIRVPKNWLEQNELDILSMFGGRIRDRVKDRILDEAVEKIVKEIKIPKITVDAKEIKDKMLTILAERALDHNNDE